MKEITPDLILFNLKVAQIGHKQSAYRDPT